MPVLSFLKRRTVSADPPVPAPAEPSAAAKVDAPFDTSTYKRDGVQLLKGFFSESEKADLRGVYAYFKEALAAGKITRSEVHTVGDDYSPFDKIDGYPAVRRLVGSIVGENYCRLVARFLIKDDSYSGGVDVHQDYPYFGGCPDKISLFIPLTDSKLENGTLTFLKGSQRFGPLERGAIEMDRYPELERYSLDMEPGDLAIADFLVWHYSTPAITVSDRVLIQVVYQPSTDPSSKILISGRILNDVYCPSRDAPLRAQHTAINFREAEKLFGFRQYDEAERVALAILETDPENIHTLLLLRRIHASRGARDQADRYAERAKAAIQAALEICKTERI